MSKIIDHIKLVMTHKKYVFHAMDDCGFGFEGIFHDMSKFSPSEFFESVKYFQGDSSPINAAKRDKGYSDAFFHHMGRNKHHSLYWVDASFGEIKPVKMPFRYFIEYICDTIGAGKAYMKDSWTASAPLDYWDKVDNKSIIHQDTRLMIEYSYALIRAVGWDVFASMVRQGIIEDMYEDIKNNREYIQSQIECLREFVTYTKQRELTMKTMIDGVALKQLFENMEFDTNCADDFTAGCEFMRKCAVDFIESAILRNN